MLYKGIVDLEFDLGTPKIVLEISPKDFVTVFGKLLKDRKLNVNGINDMTPVVKALSEVFKIPKRGSGYICKDSFLTMFKEYMADTAR